LAWKLENWGIKDSPAMGRDEWLTANTDAAKQDVPRLAVLFRSLSRAG
jgi:hypothetical protein